MKRQVKQSFAALLMTLLLSAVGIAFPAEVTVKAAGTYEGKIILLYTSDVHGAISVTDSEGNARLGLASVAQMKQDFEDMGAYVLLLDAGGFAQGSELVYTSKGAFAVACMNATGYDIACISEAELDYGYAQMKTLAAAADFPLLGANVIESDETSLRSSAIFTTPDGTNIGVFGLVTPAVKNLLHPSRTEGVEILADAELIACAQEQVAQLQEANCDLIVCIGHLGTDENNSGNRSVDIIEQVEGIDLFIDGHNYETITEGDKYYQIGDTMLVSAGEGLEQIGMIVYDGASFRSTLYGVEDYSGIEEEVNEMVLEEEAALAARLEETIATTTRKLTAENTKESTFGNLITDAMFWQAEQIDEAVDAAVLSSGSILTDLPSGELTRNTIRAALPKEETLQILRVTGNQLLEALGSATALAPEGSADFPQVKGIQYVVDTNVPYNAEAPGSRMEILSINGTDFNPDAMYTLAVSDYVVASEAYVALSSAESRWDLNIPLDELLTDYITEKLVGEIGEDHAEPKQRSTVIIIPFTDVAISSWYFDAVQYVYEHEIMNGIDKTQFCPDASMTRGMMVTMLYRLSGSPSASTSVSSMFIDVAEDAWYAPAIAWAVETGITNGMGDNTFQPDTVLSRQQMATFFYRHAKLYGDVSVANGYELTYYDTTEIADWARDAVVYCTAADLMQGMGNNEFAPNAEANRAMGATILMRFMKLDAA